VCRHLRRTKWRRAHRVRDHRRRKLAASKPELWRITWARPVCRHRHRTQGRRVRQVRDRRRPKLAGAKPKPWRITWARLVCHRHRRRQRRRGLRAPDHRRRRLKGTINSPRHDHPALDRLHQARRSAPYRRVRDHTAHGLMKRPEQASLSAECHEYCRPRAYCWMNS
jgi:hypothetical protein